MANIPSDNLARYLLRRSMEERESLEDFAPVRSVVSACGERSAGSKSRLGSDEVVAVGAGGGGSLNEAALGGTLDAR